MRFVTASIMCGILAHTAPAYELDLTKWVQLPERLQKYSSESAKRWNLVGGPLLEWRVFSREGLTWSMTSHDFSSNVELAPPFSAVVDGYEFTRYDTYAKTDDGWLISFRRGEWGGALYWLSEDGREYRLLGPLQVNQFLREGNRFLAVQGLTHLMTRAGSLIEIYRRDDGSEWQYRTVLTTPSAAYALARFDDGTLWIALFDAIVSLNDSGKLRTLVKLPWDSRHPNSIALAPDGDKVYVGGRFWVTEADVRTRELRGLVPRELLNQLESKSTVKHPEWITKQPSAVTLPAPDPGLQ